MNDATPHDSSAARQRAFLTAYLRETDAACPNCHYNLRGLQNDRCPECGEPLALRVNLVEPKLTEFVLGLVALSMSLGFSSLFFGGYAFYVLRTGNLHSSVILNLFGTGVSLLVSALLLLLWVKGRLQLRKLQGGARWSVALGCWGLLFVNMVLLISRLD